MALAIAILLIGAQMVIPALQTPVSQAAELTPDEIAFAARLHDSHRKFFVEKLTPLERKEIMDTALFSSSAHPGDDAIAECRISKQKKMGEVQ
jgi:hypothetical protein